VPDAEEVRPGSRRLTLFIVLLLLVVGIAAAAFFLGRAL